MAQLMTVEELAEYLRITKRTIYRLLKKGNIPAVKVGHKWRFDKETIDNWLHPKMESEKVRILVIDDDPVIGLLFKE
ncbi:MAG: helix-turn-helix domain-containing protein, partial [Dehalococcoidia bacterium]|nr:helix-turn-helix domain-containing protein [Dehalococcoidia bacterium]